MTQTLTRRQLLLQVQQQLIELVPDRVDVELLSDSEIRLSNSRKGGPHKNHTHLTVYVLFNNVYSVVKRQGRKQINTLGNFVSQQDMYKQVMSAIYILGVWR